MAVKAKDQSNLTKSVAELLPPYLLHNHNINFLLHQIDQNIKVLSSLPLDENNASQFQLWEKCIEHLFAIKQAVEIKIEEADEKHPHWEELKALADSHKLEKFNDLIIDIQKNKLSHYVAFQLKSQLTRELSNFQSSRIPSLNKFLQRIEDITNSKESSEQKVLNLKQEVINYYYDVRKASKRIELLLFRKSREVKLGDTLKRFVDHEILAPYGIKAPELVSMDDTPIQLDKLSAPKKAVSIKQDNQ